MKRIFLVMVVLAQVAVAGVALATPVAVDFSGLNTTVDLGVVTFPPFALNGVTFTYDSQGNLDSNYNPTTAFADSIGIYGYVLGALSFTFSAPANGLNFNFALLNATGPTAYGVVALFGYGGIWGDSVVVPAAADAFGNIAGGSLAYSGAPFDQAVMYFSYDPLLNNDQLFSVDTISYDPVPIPGALPLVGSGLLVLAGWGWRFRKN